MELLPLLCPDRTDRLTLMEGEKIMDPRAAIPLSLHARCPVTGHGVEACRQN